MSYQFVCDYCGNEIIQKTEPFVTITVNGARSQDHWSTGYMGHYHVDECWDSIFEALTLVHDAAPSLQRIPTMSQIEADGMRAAHNVEKTSNDLRSILDELVPKVRYALPRAGIRTVEQIEAMTDEQLLRVDGIGQGTVDRLRRLIMERRPREEA